MNWFRYLFFSFVSLLIHGLAFSKDTAPTVDYVASTSQQRALSIQLFTAHKTPESAKTAQLKEPSTVGKTKVVKEKSIKEAPKKLKKQPAKMVEKEVKSTSSKVPLVKDKVMPIATVKKKELPSKPPQTESKSAPVSLSKTPPPPVKSVVEPKNEVPPLTAQAHFATAEHQDVSATQPVPSGKTLVPKMIDKVTFSARPTAIKYPRSAKRRNLQGRVLVEVWLDEQGKQTKQQIITSSGHQVLDDAAIESICAWQFSRQHSGGQAIAYRIQVPINFELH